jgi:hypothetical protein
MKYEKGDKVKVKTWDALEKEFGLNFYCQINTSIYLSKHMDDSIPKNRIVTIENKIIEGVYTFNECPGFRFSDDMFEGLAEPELKRGDLVVVSYDNLYWDKRIFLAYIKGADKPYICVCGADEARFSAGKTFGILEWRYAKPYTPEKKPVTLELTDEQLEKIKELIKE